MAQGALQMSLANLVDYLTQEEEDRVVPLSALADAIAGGARQPLDLAFGEEAVTQAGRMAAATPGGVAKIVTEDIPAMAALGGDLAGAIAQPSTQRLQSGREAGAAARQGLSALADLIAKEGAMGITRRGLEAMGEGMGQAIDERGFAAFVGPEDAIPGGGKLLAALGMAAPVAKKSLFNVTPQVKKASLENPAVRRRESMREGGETIIEDQVPIEKTIIQPEDLQGRVGVPFMADRSRAGGNLTQVGGVPLSRPVPLQGGEDYPLVINPNAAWASNAGIAVNKQNNAIKALEATGKAPVGVFTVMGERGIDFSTPVIEAMVGQLESIRVPKKSIKKFDDTINEKINKINKTRRKEGRPEMPRFVGLNHPDAMDQLLGINEYPHYGSGNLRKLLVQEMFGTEFRDIGFPVYHDVMNAVTKPELMPLNRGDAGTTMFSLEPDSPLSTDSRHSSYDTAIPGSYLGGLESAVPAQVMYPKTFDYLATQKTKPEEGKPSRFFTEDEKIGSLGMAHHWEVFDQEWVDKVSEWLQSSEAKKGGAAMVLAPLFFGAAQLEQLEQE
tara:strand:- start:216 stop:1889 length:1674 start_codon:yes stop_codon:yes gene_type:complete